MNPDTTPTTADEAAAPAGPSVPMEAVMERYARELATMTQRALVAEAMAAELMSAANNRADGVG